MKTEKILSEFEIFLKINNSMSKNTVKNYLVDVKQFLKYIDVENISLMKTKEKDVQKFLSTYKKTHSTSSQYRKTNVLRMFFKFLILKKYIKENPLEKIQAPKVITKPVDIIPINDIKKMFAEAKKHDPFSKRNAAILAILYGAGVRSSELVEIKISDVIFKSNFLKITGNRDKQRFVPINDFIKTHLKNYLKKRSTLKVASGHEDVLFLNKNFSKMSKFVIFKIVKKLSKPLKSNIKISPHTLRQTFATHLIENGADLNAVQKILGNASIDTTEAYLHKDLAYLQTQLKEFHPLQNLDIE